MAIVPCPYCEHEIDLGSGDAGYYQCPHCGEEFEFVDDEAPEHPTLAPIGLGLVLLFVFVVVPLLILLGDGEVCVSYIGSGNNCPGGGP